MKHQISARTMPVMLLAIAALTGLIVSIYNYLTPGTGIDGTEGAMLVIVSSLLILGASLLVALVSLPAWLFWTFEVLILLGIIGTMAAAYLLMSWILLGAMVAALLAHLIHLFMRPARPALA